MQGAGHPFVKQGGAEQAVIAAAVPDMGVVAIDHGLQVREALTEFQRGGSSPGTALVATLPVFNGLLDLGGQKLKQIDFQLDIRTTLLTKHAVMACLRLLGGHDQLQWLFTFLAIDSVALK